ncbi:MAG TPA: TolC family protein [Burkholderiaceae bacterium]|jgi:outer membrane protein TolC|nr:TolC family protein [Burkholderiaceae bacterium]
MRPFLLALGLLASLHAYAETFADVLNKAWLRLPEAQSQVHREIELNANRSAASGVFPAPPVVGLSERTDRFNDNAGAREYEAGISVPMWLPGEKTARQRLAVSEKERFTAAQSALRLQVAGELREAAWQIKLAENARARAQGRLASAQHTEADVVRRVKAGELARTDLLLVQGETLSAQDAAAVAGRELALAQQVYERIVGDQILPAALVETEPAAREVESHPLLVLKRERVGVARAKAQLVSQTRRDNPEISIGVRRERADSGERFGDTLVASLRIPLGTESRNAPRTAAAQADLTEAEVDYQRQRAAVEQNIQRARLEIDTVKQRLILARSRHALAQENFQLIRKAFSLGEKSLFEFQRTQAVLNEAALEAGQTEIELNRSYARLNQAMGVLP